MIQGAHMLPKQKNDYLVITKSMKDVMCLYQYDIPAIAPCSENIFITEAQYNRLRNKYKQIFVFYDNDLAGISAMCKIKKKFPDIKILYLPRNGDKDISDFRKAHGYKKTLELIDKTKLYYEENG